MREQGAEGWNPGRERGTKWINHVRIAQRQRNHGFALANFDQRRLRERLQNSAQSGFICDWLDGQIVGLAQCGDIVRHLFAELVSASLVRHAARDE